MNYVFFKVDYLRIFPSDKRLRFGFAYMWAQIAHYSCDQETMRAAYSGYLRKFVEHTVYGIWLNTCTCVGNVFDIVFTRDDQKVRSSLISLIYMRYL